MPPLMSMKWTRSSSILALTDKWLPLPSVLASGLNLFGSVCVAPTSLTRRFVPPILTEAVAIRIFCLIIL